MPHHSTVRRTSIAVLGAGNMGTALAHCLARNGHDLRLWDHFPEVLEEIRREGMNRRFLPGVVLDKGICAISSAIECVAGAEIVVIGVPSAFVQQTLEPLLNDLVPDAILLNVAKGFSPDSREDMPSLIERIAEDHPCVHLAGPAIANEFVRGVPAHIVMASNTAAAASRTAECFAGESFRCTVTDDVTGAAWGGILKNVYAILLGALEQLGAESRNLQGSVFATCVNEMAEIAIGHGGCSSTLYGLSGLGDLVATGFSPDSHNRRFGKLLAAGTNVEELEKQLGWLPEGARAAGTVCDLAEEAGVDAPLARWVRGVLEGAPPFLCDLLQSMQTCSRQKPRA